jgi:quercetin dioxygenase-like cupin family protein
MVIVMGETSKPVAAYSASPRPQFDGPALISYRNVTRHIWGEPEAGEVADWIYASTGLVHALVFGLAPGGAFRHSPSFRTIFRADEVLTVLQGTMILANPETGEVLRVERGDSAFFRRDTWHHAFAHGPEPLRVLELFAPPPATGSSGAYSRTVPYLETTRYHDDARLGNVPGPPRADASLHLRRAADAEWRLEGDGLVGILASTSELTVASLSLRPGGVVPSHRHAGDELLYVTGGTLHVRAWHDGNVHVFELEPGDAAYVPQGADHEYRSYGAEQVAAIVGVAPTWREE